MHSDLKNKLIAAFDDIKVDRDKDHQIVILARGESILSVLSFLKNQGYNHLALVSCVDWLQEGTFELVYVLSAYMEDDEHYTEKEKTQILLKTQISRDKSEFLSVIPIFENAEPYEREIHELFGIRFEGHPRLTPLFLERVYDIPPFRKDFDTRQYVKNVFDNVPMVEKKAEHP